VKREKLGLKLTDFMNFGYHRYFIQMSNKLRRMNRVDFQRNADTTAKHSLMHIEFPLFQRISHFHRPGKHGLE